jgi:8-oxo-dGTP pyrophosphatase MutT (NUDIX family)
VIEVVDAWLVLPDGRIVLQRRDAKASVSANLLNPFGGHIEHDEAPEEAVIRELTEETSLKPEELELKFLFEVEAIINAKDCKLFVFKASVQSMDFQVYEGAGAEAYPIDELKLRDDLSPSTKAILSKLRDNNG